MSLDVAVRERLEIDAKEIIARYPRSRSALLPMLHLVQAEEGFVSAAGMEFCADMLELTTAEVAAVATFYTMYRRRPGGTYSVGVCTNTLCAVLGGDEIFARLKEHLGIGHDETTDDATVTLQHLECNAACDYAPVMMVNWEFFDNQTPQSAVELVDNLRAAKKVTPTRGPRLCTFAEVSRVLAGFPDGLANEGPSAGPATLAGLRVARERGDEAPGLESEREGPAAREEPPAREEPAAAEPERSGQLTLGEDEATADEPAKPEAAAKKARARKSPAKKTAKTGRKRPSVPPVTMAGNAAADVRTADAASSASDAGVDTAESDRDNEAPAGADEAGKDLG